MSNSWQTLNPPSTTYVTKNQGQRKWPQFSICNALKQNRSISKTRFWCLTVNFWKLSISVFLDYKSQHYWICWQDHPSWVAQPVSPAWARIVSFLSWANPKSKQSGKNVKNFTKFTLNSTTFSRLNTGTGKNISWSEECAFSRAQNSTGWLRWRGAAATNW